MTQIKSQNEKEILLQWGSVNSHPFCRSLKSEDSYFQEFDNTDNIVLLSFHTLPQLANELRNLWKEDNIMQEIILPVSIATFKLEPIKQNSDLQGENSGKLKIPDYTYVFQKNSKELRMNLFLVCIFHFAFGLIIKVFLPDIKKMMEGENLVVKFTMTGSLGELDLIECNRESNKASDTVKY